VAVLGAELENLHLLGQSAPLAETADSASDDETPSARLAAFSDIEPADTQKSVFDAVKKAFRLEDSLRGQLASSLVSAQERGHRKLELQLKMILLSAGQRCRLLEERYGFARSKSVLVQGLRKQTTRFLSRLQGEERRDID
jgi:predicted RNase H-like nuclease